jgi:nicotinate dehydrogenase subunit B
VWAGSQSPHVLRAELAKLMGMADTAIDVVRMEAAGCYGRNGADDVAADAALLSRAVGAPVRVQLTREQEHLWEPKGAAQLMQVNGGLDADGSVAAYDFQTSYPSNGAPALALLLTRTIEPVAQAYEMGDRTARPRTTTRTCACRSTTCRPCCARRGCAACRRCRTRSRTRATSTNWPKPPAPTRWSSACAT